MSVSTSSTLGHQMSTEMAEQPAVLEALVERLPAIAEQVRTASGEVRGVAFLARGSSDHAALLGRYSVDLSSGLPTTLVAPSLQTAYGTAPAGYEGWVLVALSQSGRTPEIVDLAGRFRQAGATVVAISNDAASPLASTGTVSVDLQAGPERAVPATKTVTAQMLATLAVVDGLTGGSGDLLVSDLGDQVRTVLADQDGVDAAAEHLARYERLAVVARGLCYPAAKETALKLQETTGAMAHGFSTADFRHGPIAVSGPQAPVILLAGTGPADEDTLDLQQVLRRRRAPVITVGAGPDAEIFLPDAVGSAQCVLATVRGQQLALAICRARGLDPDSPAGLSKVTLTR